MVPSPDKPDFGRGGVSRPQSDVVDVQQYSFGRGKMAAGLVALATWCATIWWLFLPYLMGQASPLDHFLGKIGRGYVWGEDPAWAQNYANQCLTKNFYGCASDTTPFEFMVLQFHANPKSYIIPLIALVLIAIGGFAWFFMRRPAPIRFNRKVGAIYGVSEGTLWIRPATDFDFAYEGEWDPLSGRFNSSGPMQVWLYDAQKPSRKRKFKLGAYPPGRNEYGKQLGQALRNFLAGMDPGDIIVNASAHASVPWWQNALLGPKHLPKNIDTRAADWLNKGL